MALKARARLPSRQFRGRHLNPPPLETRSGVTKP